VEVVSPTETAEETWEKVRDYLEVRTRLVRIYPRTRKVAAYTPDGIARTLGTQRALEDATLPPGFTCKIAVLFC
jgi:hypothetical protein